MTQIMASTLQKGDLICVPCNNYLFPAIFMGFKNRTLHFHLLSEEDRIQKRIDIGKKPYITYINRKGPNILAKIHPSELEPLEQGRYSTLYNTLKQNGYI